MTLDFFAPTELWKISSKSYSTSFFHICFLVESPKISVKTHIFPGWITIFHICCPVPVEVDSAADSMVSPMGPSRPVRKSSGLDPQASNSQPENGSKRTYTDFSLAFLQEIYLLYVSISKWKVLFYVHINDVFSDVTSPQVWMIMNGCKQ